MKVSSLLKVTSSSFRVFLAVVMLMASIQAPLTARAANEDDAKKLLAELQNPDLTRVSSAAERLADYQYEEVESALLEVLESQLKQAKPNSHIISGALKGLNGVITAKSAARMKSLTAAADGVLSSAPWYKHVKPLFVSAQMAAQSTSKPNPQLFKITPMGAQATGNGAGEKGGKNGGGGEGPIPPHIPFKDQTFFGDYIDSEATKSPNSPEAILKTVAKEVLTDRVRRNRAAGKDINYYGREKEAGLLMDVLMRIKGKNPVLNGPAGVGKTTAVEIIARKIVDGDLPISGLYRRELGNAEIIETSAGRISRLAKSNDPSSQAAAIEAFFDSVIAVERKMEEKAKTDPKFVARTIIVYIDEIHELSDSQIEAMKPYMDSKDHGIRLIGSSTSEEFQLKFKFNKAARRRFKPIAVEEFSEKEAADLLKQSWMTAIESRYNVDFSEKAIEAAVRISPSIMPDNARPDGPFKVLQDIAIRTNHDKKGERTVVSDKMVYQYASFVTGLPSDPHDGVAFYEFLKKLETDMKAKVVDQESMVKSIVQMTGEMLSGEAGIPVVGMLLGTTGSGKTHAAKTLSKLMYGNDNHFFRIEGATLGTSGGYESNALWGATNGVMSSDRTSGSFMEWLDDPARGRFGGIILIDEAEKINPKNWERFMELFDEGRTTGGDGQVRKLNRHMILLSSNRGARVIFPPTMKEWGEEEIKKRTAGITEEQLKGYFMEKVSGKDEFELPQEILERINVWMLSNPTTRTSAIGIARLRIDQLKEHIERLYGIGIEVSDAVVERLALTGFNNNAGARQVNKQVKQYLDRVLKEARGLLNPQEGDVLEIKLDQTSYSGEAELKFNLKNKDGKVLAVQAPYLAPNNPLLDPVTRKRLAEAPTKMKERLVGQDQAVDSAVEAIKAKMGESSRTKPISLLFIGSTGTGKTEFSKTLAEAFFGSEMHAAIIPAGNVKWEGDLNAIFGSKVGFSGHNQISLFEEALRNNPNGGVITFDEFSNMGGVGSSGGDKSATKESLIKEFYHIVDEGTWRSSATNKTYDLNKFIFIFTGNDGEKLFKGQTSDDMRLATWKQNNRKERIRALLGESGFPEAFIGRMADVILAKPLLVAERTFIAAKMVKRHIEKFTKQHMGVQVKYSSQFIEQLADAFFSHDTGGRSIRSVVEDRMGAILSIALLETGYDVENMKDTVIELNLNDNQGRKGYVTRGTPERKAILEARITVKGKEPKTFSRDLTEFASIKLIPEGRSAVSTWYHEIGHALLNDPAVTGQRFVYATAIGGSTGQNEYLGYARYEAIPGYQKNPDEKSVIAQVAVLTAGRVAQNLAGYPTDAGWSQDLKEIRTLVNKFIVNWGIVEELRGTAIGANGEPQFSRSQLVKAEEERNRIIVEGERVASAVLRQYWGVVRDASAFALKNKSVITGEQLMQIFEKSVGKKFGSWTYEQFEEREKARAAKREQIRQKGAASGSTARPAQSSERCIRIMDFIGKGAVGE